MKDVQIDLTGYKLTLIIGVILIIGIFIGAFINLKDNTIQKSFDSIKLAKMDNLILNKKITENNKIIEDSKKTLLKYKIIIKD